MKDLKLLERMLDLLNESGAGAIEVRKSLFGTKIRVSKNAFPNSGPVTYQVSAEGGNPAPTETVPPSPFPVPQVGGEEGGGKGEVAAEPSLTDITSPMVGTFYAQPEPGAEPYVRVGGRVKVGQTVCIIEAMKIMNPIDAEVAGVIKEIVVQDAQPVEFGQALYRVDPNG
jgi:acetyl-CoA carboxylase biotin carboxyl carrier protein